MQRLAEVGVLPITTPGQRARNKCSAGSAYGVPAAFAYAKTFQLCASELSASDGILLAMPRIGVDPLCDRRVKALPAP